MDRSFRIRRALQKFTLLTAVGLLLSSCLKQEEFPVIPEIKYEAITLEYDTGKYAKRAFLTFSFRDGDGDIGLDPDQKQPPFDTGSIYHYNLIIDYYEKRGGQFVKVDLKTTFNARIPNLTPDDPNKAIKGIITDTLLLNPVPVYDTVKLKFFIYDRALHQSNIDSTPAFLLSRR